MARLLLLRALYFEVVMPAGRPTKYRKQYCEDIIKFFDIPATTLKSVPVITKFGTELKKIEVANPLPTIEGFARKLGVMTETIVNWAKEYPEFFTAYTRAKSMSKEILNQNALMGRYSEGYAKFVAINCTDMVDKSRQEQTGADGGDIKTKITVEFIGGD